MNAARTETPLTQQQNVEQATILLNDAVNWNFSECGPDGVGHRCYETTDPDYLERPADYGHIIAAQVHATLALVAAVDRVAAALTGETP